MWWRRRPKESRTIVGECHACGACCRDLILVDAGRSVRSRRQFRRLVKRKPEFAMFRPESGESAPGELHFHCERLGDDGRCTAYDARPALCRRYPDPRMLRHDADLPAGCGYRIVPRQSFARLLEKEHKRRRRRGWRRFLPGLR